MSATQAEVNIGTAGHVDHGKTSIVKALTGEWTDRHSEEIKRGITIRLGYSDASFYACDACKGSEKWTVKDKCAAEHPARFVRKVSFVDCPGHETLMAVMLSGASLMDGAMFVIAANEECPQPQTAEHLAALGIIGIKNIVIVQNKVDLVTKEQAEKNYAQIQKFVKGTVAENAPIIPASANYGLNIDALIEALQEHIPTPKRDDSKALRMYVARSFDVNRPGTEIETLRGGVIGGSIISGSLKIDDEIEIRPGLESKDKYEPFITKVSSLSIKEGELAEARPGGLIGVGTLLDPSLTKSDRLIGNLVGKPGTLPPARKDLTVETHLLERVMAPVEKIKKAEPLVVNSGTMTTLGVVSDLRGENALIALKKPICVDAGDKVALSRRVGNRWTLIGYGVVK
jgi:translation initiation factor 2 subunit 3